MRPVDRDELSAAFIPAIAAMRYLEQFLFNLVHIPQL